MKEALIGLFGVLLGGLIGIFGQFLNLYFENKKWKKEKSIEILKFRKEDLERMYEHSSLKLQESFEKNTFDLDTAYNFIHIYPKNVYTAYQKWAHDRDGDGNLKKENFWRIKSEMKKSLVKIDEDIIDLLKK